MRTSTVGLLLGIALFASSPHCRAGVQESPGETATAQEAVQPPNTAPSGNKKLALLIGINDYQHLPDLHGAVNDVEAVKDLLVRTFQFPEGQIRTLFDSSATRKGILSAIREHLIAQAQPGSVVVFHYSGHGSRKKDASGDEPDGYDETLVPNDSGRGEHENRDITDDELNEMLRKLSAKGSHVTFVLDSCFSGSALRAPQQARFVEADEREPLQPVEGAASRSVQEGESGFRPADARYVLIAGAADQEQAYEVRKNGKTFGSLTWYLTQEIRLSGPDATYRDLMDLVRARVSTHNSLQHPQLEGALLDNLVFSDRALPPQPYVLAFPMSGPFVRLEAGQLHGMTAGSVFDVYAPGTKDFAATEPKARIKLIEVEASYSLAEILKGGEVAQDASRGVEREHSFEDLSIGIRFENLEGSPKGEILITTLLGRRFIHRVDQPQGYDLLIREKDGYFVIESGASTEASARVPVSDEDAVARIASQVAGWARWYGAISIANPMNALDIEFGVEKSSTQGRNVAKTSRDLDLVLGDGEEFNVRLTNRSDRALFFALLDISASGSISLVYPRNQARERLAAGRSWTKRLEAYLPPGRDSERDLLKVIATTEETDFSFLQQDEPRGPEVLNALQQLLANSLYGEAREVRAVETGDWATVAQVVEVKRR